MIPAGSTDTPSPEPTTTFAPTPPKSVRVNTETLDRFLSSVGEVILSSTQLRTSAENARQTPTAGVAVGLDRMDRVVGELQRRAMELRTTALQRIVEPLPRVGREVAQLGGKRVEVEIQGAELELDRSILDRLSDPLVHLVRNAVDHGIETPEVRAAAGKPETGSVLLVAREHKDLITISITDDGAGIDIDAVRARAVERGLLHEHLADDLPSHEIAALVFHPGLSTASEISRISGRGVGMDAVRTTIQSLGGHVEIETVPGRGTTTTIVVPIDATLQRVLLLGMGDEIVAIPVSKVERIVEVAFEEVERSGDEAFVLIEDEPVPVLSLAGRTSQPDEIPQAGAVTLVLSEVRGARVALCVERVVRQLQIYVKPTPDLLSEVPALMGMTIMGDGRPVFVLDLNQLA